MVSRRFAALVALACGVGVAGCGSASTASTSAAITPPPLDAGAAAALVTERQHAATPGLHLGAPACVPATDGAGFVCSIGVEDVTVSWNVAVTSAGETQATPVAPAIEVARAVAAVRQEFASEGPVGSVDCGAPRVVILPVDEELTCTIVDGQRRRTVHVVVLDRDGSLRVVP